MLPWILGVRKLPSSYWMPRNSTAVRNAVVGETVSATITAGIAPSQALRYGMNAPSTQLDE